jgi:hypothetical protein
LIFFLLKKDLNLTNLIQETAQNVQAPFERMADDLDESINYEPQKNYFVQQQQLEKEVKAEINLPLNQQTISSVDSDNVVQTISNTESKD